MRRALHPGTAGSADVTPPPEGSGDALREAARLLAQLEGGGVTVEARDGELRFRAPKGVVTPDLRARLVARRDAILALVARRRDGAGDRTVARGPSAQPMERVDRGVDLPLSFAQERLWFLEQWQSGDWLYNGVNACHLSGPLDVSALERTIEEIVCRHEILRTTFPAVDGRPVQRIAPPGRVPLPMVDLRHLPPDEGRAEADRLMTEETRRPFDVARGPLVRGLLIRLDDEEHVWVPVMHHIVCDAWSNVVSSHEMQVLYRAFAAGDPSPLEDVPVQYADFAIWQRRRLSGEILEAELEFWRGRLADLPVLELPTDRPRPAVQSFRGATCSTLVPASLAGALREVARREGATPFMALLAAFKALLMRYCGQEDVVVGTPVAGRNRPEVEGLIGFFVNMLVLRTDCSGDPSFRSMLRRVRETCLGAMAHQELPFEKLVEELQPRRDLSRNPLFQVVFSLQGSGTLPDRIGDAVVTPIAVESGRAKYDLTLTLVEQPDGGLRCSIEFATDLFDVETVARMADHYRTLLEAAVADPDRTLWELPLLPGGERHRMLTVWNDTARPYPDACLHELVEAQARRTPGRAAVVFGEEALTYTELDARANRLAGRLRALGVGPDRLVGVCMERSLDMVVALLAVLKSGGAYVPLDPGYPPSRIAFMIEDAEVSVLLTQESLAGRVPAGDAPVIRVDADWPSIAGEPDESPSVAATPDDLAYVIYTSGSTGTPKGVQIPHGALVNFLWSMRDRPGLGPDDVLLAVTSISFDIAALELFLPLIAGARAVVLDRDAASDGAALGSALERSGATVLQATPSTWRLLLESGWRPSHELKMLCGGEAMPPALAARLLEGGGELWNMYGPTETTVWSAVERIAPGVPISIGRPIANTQIYLLDRSANPVPVGVPGELYIGGDGLARGYLRRPDLTTERFVPDPFSSKSGSRLYRTGDLARFRCDGSIEYFGRIDHQVKVRGHRIELGEIEATLGAHPNVRECAVVAREDAETSRLVAYVVPRRQPSSTVSELREFLRRTLPEPMLPQHFVTLEALLLTPNGKVDRAALPAPDGERPSLSLAYVAPRTPVETVLAGVWANTLGVKRVGIDDNFFEVGGDSLLSIQVVARAAREGVSLTAKQIFLHQTVRELAAAVGAIRPAEGDRELVTGAVPLAPIQHWLFEQDLPAPGHWNEAVLLELERVAPSAAERALREVLSHHDALRSRFVRGPAGWEQFITVLEAAVPFSSFDLAGRSDEDERAAIRSVAAEMHQSLDLVEGPVLRVALFDRGPGRPAVLLVVAHHLIVDGVSWRILLEDLGSCIEQIREGHDPALPPKTTSFKRWAERLSAHARSGLLRGEADLWVEIADAGASGLPVEFGSPPPVERSTEVVEVSLGPAETAAALRRAPVAHGASVEEMLLGALSMALAPWAQVPSLPVDVMRHGREGLWDDIDLSRTVGWCTALFPVALPLDGDAPAGESLRAVSERLRRVPSGGGIGFGLLRYLSGDAEVSERLRRLSRGQVLFNYQGQLDGAFAGPVLGPAGEPPGPKRHPGGCRPYLLEVEAFVLGRRLRVRWSYSSKVYRRQTIERVALGFLRALRLLVRETRPDFAMTYRPASKGGSRVR